RLRIRAYSSEGNEIVNPGSYSGYDVRGQEGFVFIRLENQGGGQLYWRCGFFPADQPAPPDYDYDVAGGIVNGAYAGTATGWYLWHEDIPDAAWGHVVLGNANALWDAETNGRLARLVSAYNGERAADRIQRLCDEEDLLLHITDSG